MKKPSGAEKREDVDPGMSPPSFNVRLNHENLVAVPCVVGQDILDKCPFNGVFVQRVVNYFHDLQWDFDAPNVSCLELYVDFCLWTGTIAPCLLHVGDRNARGPIRSYALPDLSPAADVVQFTLREQSRVWSKILAWAWLGDHCHTVPSKPERGCSSLLRVGYYQQHYGVAGHPLLRCGRRVSIQPLECMQISGCRAIWECKPLPRMPAFARPAPPQLPCNLGIQATAQKA